MTEFCQTFSLGYAACYPLGYAAYSGVSES